MDAMLTRADLTPEEKQELEQAAKTLISDFTLWILGDSLLRDEWKRLRCVNAKDTWGEKYITERMRKDKEELFRRARQMGKTAQFINEMMKIFEGIPPDLPSDDEIAARCIEMVRNPPAIEVLPFPKNLPGPY